MKIFVKRIYYLMNERIFFCRKYFFTRKYNSVTVCKNNFLDSLAECVNIFLYLACKIFVFGYFTKVISYVANCTVFIICVIFCILQQEKIDVFCKSYRLCCKLHCVYYEN